MTEVGIFTFQTVPFLSKWLVLGKKILQGIPDLRPAVKSVPVQECWL